MTDTTDLMIPQTDNLPAAFKEPEQIDKILGDLRGKAEAFKASCTVETAKGRREIASFARRIASSKAALDAAGKSINDELRKTINVVDAERRRVRAELDDLRDDVRAPLTKWEADEEARVSRLKERLANLAALPDPAVEIDAARNRVERLEAFDVDQTWQEFREQALAAHKASLNAWRQALTAAEERAELARLRAEKEERERQEAERARLAREDEERRAREAREAEAAAEAERQRQAALEKAREEERQRAAKEAEERIEAEKRRAAGEVERAKREAEEAIRKAEQARIAEAEKKAAEEARIRAEKEAEDKRLEADAKKRAEDKAHRAKVRKRIADQIVSASGVQQKTAETIAEALMAGEIPHCEVRL